MIGYIHKTISRKKLECFDVKFVSEETKYSEDRVQRIMYWLVKIQAFQECEKHEECFVAICQNFQAVLEEILKFKL